MKQSSVLRVASLGALAASVACSGDAPVTPVTPPTRPLLAAQAAGSDEPTTVSAGFDAINAQLTARGANYRLAVAEIRMDSRWDGLTSTLVLANDRFRGTGFAWVKGDPRRNGRAGVTYELAPEFGARPVAFNATHTGFVLAPFVQLDQQLEEGMGAWRALKCSAAPITRVPVPAGTDPAFLDQLFMGQLPNPNYVQSADIVHAGWQPLQFFRNIAQSAGLPPTAGDNIIGITFGFAFVNGNGAPTDIDRDRRADLQLAEIYFNTFDLTRPYDNRGDPVPGIVDFYSVIAHESGHALGLGHLGKIFITKHDLADGGGVSVSEVKFAPNAMMNAAYVAGRSEITGLDNSQFCEIWAGR